MKERPILFSSPMVRAILEGRKTQTRRIVKHIPVLGGPIGWCAAAKAQEPGWVHIVGDYRRFCPYGVPGDRLWVRETWGPSDGGFCYRASERQTVKPDDGRWHPAIHMFRCASRITLEIEAVRVERLIEITREDCIAEGVEQDFTRTWFADDASNGLGWVNPEGAYRELWESINGHGSWDANPYVWVIQFRRVS